MRHAGRKQAQADQPILFFQPPQRAGQFVFLPAQRRHGFIARAHQIADFVAQDVVLRNQLPLPVAGLRGGVGVQHLLQAAGTRIPA